MLWYRTFCTREVPRFGKTQWEHPQNQRIYLTWLADRLNIKQKEDWYSVKTSDVIKYGGHGLLVNNEHSLIQALCAVYPEQKFLPWLFEKVPQGFWDNTANQRSYLDWLASQLNITKAEDWYSVKVSDVVTRRGGSLLSRYGGSLSKALMHNYPEHKLQAWKFHKVPQKFWDAHPNQRQFLEWLGKQLHLHTWQDWYNVTGKELWIYQCYQPIKQRGGLKRMLPTLFPEYPWNTLKLSVSRHRTGQHWLKKIVQQLFPTHEILEDHLYQDMLFSQSNRPMQLDIFVPCLALAFEYQGIQHYEDVYYFGNSVRLYEQRDEEKRQACRSQCITLVEVPYWWDHSVDSLVSSIQQKRPDIVSQLPSTSASPIPTSNPNKTKARKDAERIARLITLAKDWNWSWDPTGWWMTEKYDGIRAYWDGQHLFSKQGHRIHAPSWFLQSLLSSVPLDGELWLGRSTFQQVMGLTKTRGDRKLWENVKYCVFDTPHHSLPYESRLQIVRNMHQKLGSYVQIVQPVKCEGQAHLQHYLQEVTDGGGEGVMLRKPNSSYEHGRSDTLYKVKNYKDTEVRFISLVDHAHYGKAMLCETTTAEKCFVRCSGDVIRNPPAVGAVITVTYEGVWDSGKLKAAQFMREREDLSWIQARTAEAEEPDAPATATIIISK